MRSAREIAFRLRQESANLLLLATAPRAGAATEIAPLLPNPQPIADALRGTPYADEIVRLAEESLPGRFHLLGLPPIAAGDPIHWRRDYVHQVETPPDYFRLIPYLDFTRAGDHKIVWELNRHQHLVTLAQAYLLTGRADFLDVIPRHIESWLAANPFQRGINWSSALEVAFRALSWAWTFHLAGGRLDPAFRRRWLDSLYQHGRHLEYNLSVYFSPNTHLLGEAVVLHALGTLFPGFPRSFHWRETGARLVAEQMEAQVRPDGSHFEQSAYYHLYATDFFVFHLLLNPTVSEAYRERLILMAEYLDAITDAAGRLALFGDDDGGRLFHPYGDRMRFPEATLATCARLFERPDWIRDPAASAEQSAWWLGTQSPSDAASPRSTASRLFPGAGVAALAAANTRIIVNAGPMGSGTAGHSHAGALAIIASFGAAELLIDPGAYTYISDPAARQRFRGTAAHNTLTIDGQDQATPSGPFRWTDPPETEILAWSSSEAADILDARCRYRGFTHRRSLVFLKPGLLLVLDRVEGPPGEHLLEQRWLSPQGVPSGFLSTVPPSAAEPAERSRAFASLEPATRRIASLRASLPAAIAAAIGFGHAPVLSITQAAGGAYLLECEQGAAFFPPGGPPKIRR